VVDVADATAKLVARLGRSATWREDKAEEYPDDERNWQTARALRRAASEIAALPDDDPRLLRLAHLYDNEDTAIVAIEAMILVIGRHGFDSPDATTDELLTALVAAADLAEIVPPPDEDVAGTVREGRLRQRAVRQHLRLIKSHTREPRAPNFGHFMIVNDQNAVVGRGAEQEWMTLDEIDRWLADLQ